MRKCIIWDFDHTLAYRDGMWTQSVVNVMEKNGYRNVDSSKIHNFFKKRVFPWDLYEKAHDEYFKNMQWWDYVNENIIKKAFIIAGCEDKDIDKMTSHFRGEYLRKEAWFLFDDTITTLKDVISRGFDNIILSNHVPELCELVEYLKIDIYFKEVYTSAKIGYEKPNQEIFNFVFRNLNYEKYIMVGDNPVADIEGAKKAGIDGILVRREKYDGKEKYSKMLTGILDYI